jgi:hypothetical protein
MRLVPHEVILVSAIPNCWFCEHEGLGEVPGPYDFATRMGAWANGCKSHFDRYSATRRLGTGMGQLWVTADQVTP